MSRTYWIETLGCPKNQVDSEKLEGRFASQGMEPAEGADSADVVVVNTCAFVEAAREESIGTILELADDRKPGAKLVVTGCFAERHPHELAAALPEVDAVLGFGHDIDAAPETQRRGPAVVPVGLGPTRRVEAPSKGAADFDLLNLPRPASARPWAYVKIAEGCDRACGFCAIPSFRGPQRSRTIESILDEVDGLNVQEVVLVAQDLAAFGRDAGVGARQINELTAAISERVEWVRLLYLYPSDLNDRLIDTILATGVSYFDLSLQHASGPLLRRMRRFGDGHRFLDRIERIRSLDANAAFRSNVIVGYPGETEEDHDVLLEFVEAADLDWLGVFPYSNEPGTYAAGLDGMVDPALVTERVQEVSELADRITMRKRADLIGQTVRVLVDESGIARSHREAPEIDGIINVPSHLQAGTFQMVQITGAETTDLVAETLR